MFKKLLLEHRKLRNSHKQLQEMMKKRDDTHNAALKKEQGEVSRLQKELKAAQHKQAETEKTFAAEKKQLEEAAAKQKRAPCPNRGSRYLGSRRIDHTQGQMRHLAVRAHAAQQRNGQ